MPTVIDELIVTLGLDPSKFVEGQHITADQYKKFAEGLQKHNKDITEGSKDTADAITAIKKGIVELGIAYLGFTAIKNFAKDLVESNLALNNTAAALGLSTERLSTMRTAAELAGGSAQGMVGTLRNVQRELTNIATFKTPNKEFLIGATMLGLPQSSYILPSGQAAKPEDFLDSVRRAAQQQLHAGTPPAAVSATIQRLGITDEGMIAALMQKTGDQFKRFFEEGKKLAPTNQDIDAVMRFNEEWKRLTEGIRKLGDDLAPLLNDFLPFIQIMDKIVGFVDKIVGSSNEAAKTPSPYSPEGRAAGVPIPKTYGEELSDWWHNRHPSTPSTPSTPSDQSAPYGRGPHGQALPAPSGGSNAISPVESPPGSAISTTPLPQSRPALPSGTSASGGPSSDWVTPAAPALPGDAAAAVDDMMQMQGLSSSNPGQAAMLRKYMKDGGIGLDPSQQAWCAAFVNAALQHHNIRGSGSNMASSFKKWGQPATGDVKKGDVVYTNQFHRGSGHVGIATGKVLDDGRIEVEAGNTGHKVNRFYADPNQATVRRSPPLIEWGQHQAVPWLSGPGSPQSLNQNSTHNTSTAETHIGYINVVTQATDARGIAGEIAPMLKNRIAMMAGNTGPV